MPLAERDSNGSGRNSRASNMSDGRRSTLKGPPPSRGDIYSQPGVASMLRTSTELGNLSGMISDTSTMMPNVPRAPRSGAASRMSTGSSHSTTSRRDSRPRSAQHHAWPSGSSGPRHSMTRNIGGMPDYVADTLSPTIMNLPGSSPLIPHSSGSRDGRSRSLTHASQPNMNLASNRSYSSLRTQDLVQRPRSPFDAGYPQQFRRPGMMRPVSPAVSDYTDSRPRRWPGDQQGYRGPRVPAGMAVPGRRGHRGQMGPGMEQMGPSVGRRSPAYYANPDHHQGIPPVPQIPSHHRHRAVSHTRIAHRPARGSMSIAYPNQRGDSDAPSSDEPSPPTPKDGPLMGSLISPTGARMIIDRASVDYYDGSEEFYEREELGLTEPDTVVTGYGDIKTIDEERVTVETPQERTQAVVLKENVPIPDPGVAELPASPVHRRITRDYVHSVLYDKSGSTDSGTTGLPEIKHSNETTPKDGKTVAGAAEKEIVRGDHEHRLGLERTVEIRHSIISHADTTLMESSTVELAIRFSSPGPNGMQPQSENVTTDDGMSDLLDGYQHTSVQDDSIVEENPVTPAPPELDTSEKRSTHTPGQSSDQQSFKSCSESPEPRCKDSEAKSFKTCKASVTPDRSISMPETRMSPALATKPKSPFQRPVSEMPLSSPAAALRKKHHIPLRSSSSFQKVGSKIRAHSNKMSSRNASTVTSIGSSLEGGITTKPIIPARESSVSKEAQTSTAVASYLLGRLRQGRFSKKSRRGNDSPQPSISEDLARPSTSENQDPRPSTQASQAAAALDHSEPSSSGPVVAFDSTADRSTRDFGGLNSLSKAGSPGRMAQVTPSRQRAQSTPSVQIPPPSSVYSADNISSSSKGRTLSSPPDYSNSPEHNSKRDSQSTTHLVWPSRRSMHMRASTTPERARGSNDCEDTTTDLRLSGYRNPMQMHYLPDLKEESHEDSSLNTSASNLKNSTFRFPHGGQPSVRASAEDARFLQLGRRGSIASVRNSALMQTRNIPSLQFSRMNLFEDLHDLFDHRSTRSFEEAERAELVRTGIMRRSTSDGMIHDKYDKYKSLFAGLEGTEKGSEGERTSPGLAALRRGYTTKDIMSDIEKLDVPSVNGLTLRLSELLPTLRSDAGSGGTRGSTGEFMEEEEIIGHVREELQEVGVRPQTQQKRSSARLRPVPGSPNMLVIEDAVFDHLTAKEREIAGIGAKAGVQSGGVAGVNGVNGVGLGEAALVELEAPPAAKLRPRALSVDDGRPSSRQSQLRKSKLSLPSTPTASTDSNPWYNDGNFPWAETAIPSVDISLPAPAALKGSPRHGPSPLRLRVSQSSESGFTSPNHSRSSVAAHLKDSTGESRDSRLLDPARDSRYKKGNNPSPSPPPFDTNGFPLGPLDIRNGDQSHEAGDRYPTSSLSPPSNVNLHALVQQPASRHSESDDDFATPRRRKLSLLPRFKSIRQPNGSSTDSRGLPLLSTDPGRAPEDTTQRSSKPVSHHSRRLTYTNASGLTTTEFHMANFQEKCKTAWDKFKGLFKRNKDATEIVPVGSIRPVRHPGRSTPPTELLIEPRPRMPSFTSVHEGRNRKRFGLFPRK